MLFSKIDYQQRLRTRHAAAVFQFMQISGDLILFEPPFPRFAQSEVDNLSEGTTGAFSQALQRNQLMMHE